MIHIAEPGCLIKDVTFHPESVVQSATFCDKSKPIKLSFYPAT